MCVAFYAVTPYDAIKITVVKGRMKKIALDASFINVSSYGRIHVKDGLVALDDLILTLTCVRPDVERS